VHEQSAHELVMQSKGNPYPDMTVLRTSVCAGLRLEKLARITAM
jgi:hypothetical protein